MLSKKRKAQILGTIDKVFYDEFYSKPEFDNPPDMWNEEEKEEWDKIGHLNCTISEQIGELFAQWDLKANAKKVDVLSDPIRGD